jgi:hypothetical protein
MARNAVKWPVVMEGSSRDMFWGGGLRSYRHYLIARHIDLSIATRVAPWGVARAGVVVTRMNPGAGP